MHPVAPFQWKHFFKTDDSEDEALRRLREQVPSLGGVHGTLTSLGRRFASHTLLKPFTMTPSPLPGVASPHATKSPHASISPPPPPPVPNHGSSKHHHHPHTKEVTVKKSTLTALLNILSEKEPQWFHVPIGHLEKNRGPFQEANIHHFRMEDLVMCLENQIPYEVPLFDSESQQKESSADDENDGQQQEGKDHPAAEVHTARTTSETTADSSTRSTTSNSVATTNTTQQPSPSLSNGKKSHLPPPPPPKKKRKSHLVQPKMPQNSHSTQQQQEPEVVDLDDLLNEVQDTKTTPATPQHDDHSLPPTDASPSELQHLYTSDDLFSWYLDQFKMRISTLHFKHDAQHLQEAASLPFEEDMLTSSHDQQSQDPSAPCPSQIQIVAYENILLSTSMLRRLGEEDLSCVLGIIRNMLHISHEQHTQLLSQLLLEGMAPHISTSLNHKIHTSITPPDQLPSIFSQTDSIWYRLRLTDEMEEQDARNRQLFVTLNSLMLWYRSTFPTDTEFTLSSVSDSEPEISSSNADETKQEEDAQSHETGTSQTITFKTEEEFQSRITKCLQSIANRTATEEDRQLFTLLKSYIHSAAKDFVPTVPFPLNLRMYKPLVELAASSLLEVDSDEEEFEDEEEPDVECREILSSLRMTRKMLGIQDATSEMMLLQCLCEQFSHIGRSLDDTNSQNSAASMDSQAALVQHIRSILRRLERKYPASTDTTDALSPASVLQQQYIFSQCLAAFCDRLMNYTQHYGATNPDMLREHLEVFFSLIRVSSVVLSDTNGSSVDEQISRACRFILRGAAVNNYKAAVRHEPSMHTNIVSMIEFEKHLYEEMQEEHKEIEEFFAVHCEQCHIDYDTVMFALLCVDVAKLIEEIGDFNPDVLHLFDLLAENWISHVCEHIEYEEQNEEDEKSQHNTSSSAPPSIAHLHMDLINIRHLFQPLVIATTPLLDAWLGKIKELFQEYLENAIKLEKWEAISPDHNYSTSAVDVIGFLERSCPFLQQVRLPNMKNYYRYYVQTCCGIVQQYCAFMVDPIPKSEKLMPFLPPIKKTKHKLFSKKTKIKVTPEDERYMRAESKRLQYGKRFNRERLFIRLNNITFVRQRLLHLLQKMDSDWASTVDSTFHGKMVTKEVDFDVLARGTCQMIKQLIQQLIDFIASCYVYIQLWEQVFGSRLYYNDAKESDLSPLMNQYFDPLLGTIVEHVEEEALSEVIIRAVFKCVVHCMEIVILDGGDHRIFYVEDHKLILRDLNSMEMYFFQDGNGISSQAFLLHCTSKLKGIVGTIMDKETESLIYGGDFNQAFVELPDSSKDSPFTKSIVYRVIYHRRIHDKVAKKWLSKTPYVWH